MAGISAEAAVEVHTETWPALGTTALLRYTGAPDPAVRAAVEREIDAIDTAASRFRADSELARVNAAGGAAVVVSRLLHDAVRLGIRAAEVTQGAVDPTLGEALITTGYDRDWRELNTVAADAPLTPGDRLVVRRQRTVLWEAIELSDGDPPTIRLPRGVLLDLGATAKALAADRAAAAAQAAGAAVAAAPAAAAQAAAAHPAAARTARVPPATDPGVLVSLGGDIATAGPAPDGGWRILVTDDHRAGPTAPGQTISIESGGLATSSIAARRWRHEGRAMHHILDPRTGEPVRTPWRTVSVAAATCADANIASTAAIVLGEEAADWLADQGLPARLVALDGSVTVQGGWPE
jgi:thiamine biosynthesis lipoprotein